MQINAFTISYLFYYYDNCIYEDDPNMDVSIYNIYNILIKQFICYFNSKDWESKEILVKYNRVVM